MSTVQLSAGVESVLEDTYNLTGQGSEQLALIDPVLSREVGSDDL